MNILTKAHHYFQNRSTDINSIRSLLFSLIIVTSAAASITLTIGGLRFLFPQKSHLMVSVIMASWILLHIPFFIFRKSSRAPLLYNLYCYSAFILVVTVSNFSYFTPVSRILLQLPQIFTLIVVALLLMPFIQFVVYSFTISLSSAVLVLIANPLWNQPSDINSTFIIISQLAGVWLLSNVVATILQFHYKKLLITQEELTRSNSRLEEEVLQAVDQIKEQQAQLHQVQKLEALGHMAGGIAHDVNNYLTAILGFGKQTLKKCDAESKLRHPLNQIMKAGQKIAALTNKLLLFSRKQPPPVTSIALSHAIYEMTPIIKHLIGKNCTLEITPPDISDYISADSVMFEQVIINLAANARDAMPDGGTITVRFSRRHFSAAECGNNPLMKPGEYIRITFADEGTGIPEDIREKIFEPFFTTKGTGKGTGLGLAVVYGIVKELSGWIDVTTSVPGGTTFTMYLPAASPPQKAGGNAHSSAKQVSAQSCSTGLNVLVVDDQPELNELVTAVLEDRGFHCRTASSVEEAYTLLSNDPARFDILFSDIILDGMNGIELAKKVFLNFPAVKIILTSGNVPEEEVHDELRDGLVCFIQKPYSEGTLITVFDKITKG